MNEEALNMEIRKFLKKVGITSQREIEKSIQSAVESGRISGDENLNTAMTLEIPHLNVTLRIDGNIDLRKEQRGNDK